MERQYFQAVDCPELMRMSLGGEITHVVGSMRRKECPSGIQHAVVVCRRVLLAVGSVRPSVSTVKTAARCVPRVVGIATRLGTVCSSVRRPPTATSPPSTSTWPTPRSAVATAASSAGAGRVTASVPSAWVVLDRPTARDAEITESTPPNCCHAVLPTCCTTTASPPTTR